jgi:flagellar assembly protein FliH
MATILRAADALDDSQIAALNFDDIAAEADRRLAQARIDAAHLMAEARSSADEIRRQAAEAGCRSAMKEVERMAAEQIAPAVAAVRQAACELENARQAWLSHWETAVVRLAAAMAAKVVRRELQRQPEITLDLVHEALELAAGSPNIRVRLHPNDHRALGAQVQSLIDAMSSVGEAEVAADEAILPGGCCIETRFGAIDQQIESQLQRIEEELTT